MPEVGIKVIKGGKLIDGTVVNPIDNATVIIEDNKIKAIGQNLQIPNGAKIIDANGKTIMPGLIDAHMHCGGKKWNDTFRDEFSRPKELSLIKSIFDAKDYLAAGFTTLKSCGGINGVFLRQAAADGILTGVPRIRAAGYMLQNTLGNPHTYLDPEYVDARTSKLRNGVGGQVLLCGGVDECVNATRYTLSRGADFIKIWPRRGAMFNHEELKAIVHTAAQVGKFVTIHCENSEDVKNAILAGAKTVDHTTGISDEIIEMGIKAGITFVSTLIVWWAVIAYGAEVGRPKSDIAYAQREFDRMCPGYKRIHKAGGVMAIGTDAGAEPLVQKFGSSAIELELLVKHCDYTPMEVIVAATKNSAIASFMGDTTGTLEPGKFADLILVDGGSSI